MARKRALPRTRRGVATLALMALVAAALAACSSDEEVVYQDENVERQVLIAETYEELPDTLLSDSASARHTEEILHSSYVTAPMPEPDASMSTDATPEAPAAQENADSDGFVPNISELQTGPDDRFAVPEGGAF